jgi:hypothetical protein
VSGMGRVEAWGKKGGVREVQCVFYVLHKVVAYFSYVFDTVRV